MFPFREKDKFFNHLWLRFASDFDFNVLPRTCECLHFVTSNCYHFLGCYQMMPWRVVLFTLRLYPIRFGSVTHTPRQIRSSLGFGHGKTHPLYWEKFWLPKNNWKGINEQPCL